MNIIQYHKTIDQIKKLAPEIFWKIKEKLLLEAHYTSGSYDKSRKDIVNTINGFDGFVAEETGPHIVRDDFKGCYRIYIGFDMEATK